MAEVQATAALEQFLSGEDGPVFKYLASAAVRVESQAKLNCSGIHVQGAQNPEGRGPRVQTGRLRSSITWVAGRDGQGPFVDIGSNVVYARFLETGLAGGRTYPFLRPALSAL